ncbi:MAG: hypothetical protein EOO65_02135 [Methanosarcinales archaeon]|nr:MAG: hypothetical protein EOO65_02135 [Methanosarcinales archaeon]
MGDVSVGQGNQRDKNETGVDKNTPLNKTFGEEGTNKTQPEPDPNATSSDVPGLGKHIERSPFTR